MMGIIDIITTIANAGIPAILLIFMIWHNAKTVDRIIGKLIENNKNKKG